MNPHRQHYFQANPQPARPVARAPSVGPGELIAFVVLVIVALAAAAAHLVQRHEASQPVVTPVHSPVVVHYQLPSMDVEDARVEGFRAGFAAAIEQACSATALTQPIATR